jgi:uncharacterized repeat protein (TIGR01451 family)
VNLLVYAANCSSGYGYATAAGINGTPPYTFEWSDGSTGPEASLPPGSYTVTVTDNTGATATSQSFTVSSSSLPLDGSGLLNNIFFAGLEPCQGQCNGGFRLYLPLVAGGYSIGTTPIMQIQEIIPPSSQPIEFYMAYELIGACPGQVVDLTLSSDCGSGSAQVTIPAALVDPVVDVLQITGSCTNSSNGYLAGSMNWSGYVLTAGWNMQAVDEFGATVPDQAMGLDDPSPVPFELFGLHPGDWVMRFSSAESTGSIQSPCVVDIPFVVPDLGADCGSLTGSAYADANENCIQNSGDPDLPQTVVVAQPGDHYALTNAAGQYSMSLPYGSYTVTTSSAVYQEHCGVSTTPFALSVGQPNVVRDLADTSLVGLDVMVTAASGPARPGFPMTMGVALRNLTGVLAGTGTVTLTYDPVLNFVSATPTPSVNGNTLTWTSPNIGALQLRTFSVNFEVPADVGLIGTVLTSTVTASVTNPEANLVNNSFTYPRMVTGSYDPNDKTALTSSRESSEIYYIDGDEWIDYTIRFQNTGNDTAFFVVITDTLPSTLDPATFLNGAASHTHSVSLSGQGILRWNFPNILLPDSNVNEPRSHGFVSFRLRPKQPVLPGTIIANIANIYFDFNPPVITEPSVLVATTGTGIVERNYGIAMQVFPNPTDGLLRVQLHGDRHGFGQLRIVAMDGRVLMQKRTEGTLALMDLSHLNAGPLLIEWISQHGERHVLPLIRQ